MGTLAALCLVRGTPAASQAVVDSTFTGLGSGRYEDSASWSPQQVPNNSGGTFYNVFITDHVVPASIDATISSLNLRGETGSSSVGVSLKDHSLTVLGNTASSGPLSPLFEPKLQVNALAHDATLDLGTLSAFSGTTLANGSYTVDSHQTLVSTLRFHGADIVRLGNVSLYLNGPGSMVTDEKGNDALRNLAFIDGLLKLSDNHLLPIAGDLTVSGILYLSGSNCNVHGNLTNFDPATRTMNGGAFLLDNMAGPVTLRFTGADIVNNNSTIQYVRNFGKGMVDENDNDAFRNFAHNSPAGLLSLAGYSMTVPGDFTNEGQITISSGPNSPGKFIIPGNFTNFDPGTKTLHESGLLISVQNSQNEPPSFFQFTGADVVHNAGNIGVGRDSHFVDENGNDALRNLATNDGGATLDLYDDYQAVVPGNFANAGLIEILNSHFTVPSGHTYTQSGGTSDLFGATLTAPAVAIDGGVMGGNGTVNGNLTVEGSGTLGPSDVSIRSFPANTMTVNGTLVVTGGAHLRFDINGGTAQGHDFISVSSGTNVGGTLDLVVGPSFVPTGSESLILLTAASPITGSFTNVASGGRLKTLDGSGSFIVAYNSKSIVASNFQPSPPSGRLLNIATRLRVQAGDSVLIGGFIVTGTEAKKVLILGIGPSLSRFFAGPLSNPTLELYQGNTLLQTNDDWKESQAKVEATGLAPTDDLESAIVRTLDPGSYTAILRGKGDATGIGVVQAYDLNQTANSKFGNIATRGFVDSGDNAMIGGFIIGPADGAAATVVVRAIGPSLTNFGVSGALQDPTLELHDGNGAIISFNDNWQDDTNQDAIPQSLKPTDQHEGALYLVLAPGNYTAVMRGAGNSTGVGLVEVYNVQ